MKTYSVYTLQGLNSQVGYIGMTSRPADRKSAHLTKMHYRQRGSDSYRRWFDHNKDCLSFVIEGKFESKEDALRQESELIKQCWKVGEAVGNTYSTNSPQHCSIFGDRHLQHLEDIRNSRRYKIKCTSPEGKVQVVLGLNEALRLCNGKSKGSLHIALKKNSTYKGWEFHKV